VSAIAADPAKTGLPAFRLEFRKGAGAIMHAVEHADPRGVKFPPSATVTIGHARVRRVLGRYGARVAARLLGLGRCSLRT
jgi:hypothetical protein